MARLLVRLKLRLLGNTLARAGSPALGLILSALFGLLAGGWGHWLLGTVPTTAFWAQLVVLVYAAVWLGWLLLPALTFSADETLDPRRFALLPIRNRRLVGGLLVAGAVGVAPPATLLATTGTVRAAVGVAGSWWLAPWALLCALLLLAVSIAWSRALLTLASRLLASRRGRDLLAIPSALMGLGLWGLLTLGPRLLVPAGQGGEDLSGLVAVARWVPGGLAGTALTEMARGRPGSAAAALAGTLAWLAAGLAAWTGALRRVQGRQAGGARARPAARAELFPLLLRWAPRTRTTAVAARFLRGLTRDARVRTQGLTHLFVVLPMLVATAGAGALRAPWSPLLAVLAVVPFGMLAANQLGLEGPALWLHEVAGQRPVADLLGRSLGLALAALPVVALLAVVLAGLGGGWAHLPAGLLTGVGALAVVLGVGAVAAVLAPAPVPDEPDNLFSSAEAGQGCLGSAMMLLTLVVQGVLLLPLGIALRLVAGPTPRALVAVAGLAYGAAVLAGATAVAARLLADRGPELLAAVDPR